MIRYFLFLISILYSSILYAGSPILLSSDCDGKKIQSICNIAIKAVFTGSNSDQNEQLVFSGIDTMKIIGRSESMNIEIINGESSVIKETIIQVLPETIGVYILWPASYGKSLSNTISITTQEKTILQTIQWEKKEQTKYNSDKNYTTWILLILGLGFISTIIWYYQIWRKLKPTKEEKNFLYQYHSYEIQDEIRQYFANQWVENAFSKTLRELIPFCPHDKQKSLHSISKLLEMKEFAKEDIDETILNNLFQEFIHKNI